MRGKERRTKEGKERGRREGRNKEGREGGKEEGENSVGRERVGKRLNRQKKKNIFLH